MAPPARVGGEAKPGAGGSEATREAFDAFYSASIGGPEERREAPRKAPREEAREETWQEAPHGAMYVRDPMIRVDERRRDEGAADARGVRADGARDRVPRETAVAPAETRPDGTATAHGAENAAVTAADVGGGAAVGVEVSVVEFTAGTSATPGGSSEGVAGALAGGAGERVAAGPPPLRRALPGMASALEAAGLRFEDIDGASVGAGIGVGSESTLGIVGLSLAEGAVVPPGAAVVAGNGAQAAGGGLDDVSRVAVAALDGRGASGGAGGAGAADGAAVGTVVAGAAGTDVGAAGTDAGAAGADAGAAGTDAGAAGTDAGAAGADAGAAGTVAQRTDAPVAMSPGTTSPGTSPVAASASATTSPAATTSPDTAGTRDPSAGERGDARDGGAGDQPAARPDAGTASPTMLVAAPGAAPAPAGSPLSASTAPTEAGLADPAAAPELPAPLPDRLSLSIRDAAGDWSVDLHRHHGSLDLLFRGDGALAGVVRDAEPEIRSALAAAGQDLGLLEFASQASGQGASGERASGESASGQGHAAGQGYGSNPGSGGSPGRGRFAPAGPERAGPAPARAPARHTGRIDRVV